MAGFKKVTFSVSELSLNSQESSRGRGREQRCGELLTADPSYPLLPGNLWK
jgi:hypothetical protein